MNPRNQATMVVRNGPLLGPVLTRVIGMLAVSEAVTNAVLHAYRDRPAGEVHVEVHRDAAEVRITVADEGAGMRPRPDSPGLGLGLPLIARLSTSLEVATGDAGGTRLCMTFPLEGDRVAA